MAGIVGSGQGVAVESAEASAFAARILLRQFMAVSVLPEASVVIGVHVGSTNACRSGLVFILGKPEVQRDRRGTDMSLDFASLRESSLDEFGPNVLSLSLMSS
jgi:hypothetical protein